MNLFNTPVFVIETVKDIKDRLVRKAEQYQAAWQKAQIEGSEHIPHAFEKELVEIDWEFALLSQYNDFDNFQYDPLTGPENRVYTIVKEMINQNQKGALQ